MRGGKQAQPPGSRSVVSPVIVRPSSDEWRHPAGMHVRARLCSTAQRPGRYRRAVAIKC
jgi:hypothetical protein